MPPNNRNPRGNDGTLPNFTSQPAVRTQIIPRPTPTFHDTKSAGMEALSGAFGSFFKQLGSAAQVMQQAEHIVNRVDIQRENEQQARKGVADAEMGTPDPALMSDNDYLDTYYAVAGQRAGQKLAADATAAMAQLPVGTDIHAWRDTFLKGEVAGGSGSPIYDAKMIAAFKSAVDPEVSKFVLNQQREAHVFKAQTFADNIYGAITSRDVKPGVDQLRAWQDEALRLNLGDRVKAQTSVITAMASAAKDPDTLVRVTSLLRERGFGENGESFEQLHPGVAEQIDAKATASWLQRHTMEGVQHIERIRSALREPGTADDPIRLVTLMRDLEEARVRVNPRDYDSMATTLTTQLTKAAASAAEMRGVADAMMGKTDTVPNQEAVNKHMSTIMSRVGVWPPKDAQQAGEVARAVLLARTVSKDVRDTMSAWIGDHAAPEQQATAFAFWQTLDSQGLAASYMDDHAQRLFRAIQRKAAVSARTPLELFNEIKANPEMLKAPSKPEEMEWPALLDKRATSKAEAYAKAHKEVVSRFSDAFSVRSSRLTFDRQAEEYLLTEAGTRIEMNRRLGVSDAVASAFDSVVKDSTGRLMLVPGANQTYRVAINNLPPGVTAPGKQFNAISGAVEDTNVNFRVDAGALSALLPGILPDADSIHVGVGGNASQGVFDLLKDGDLVLLKPGETITRGRDVPDNLWERIKSALIPVVGAWSPSTAAAMKGDAVKLPENPAEAAAKLAEILPSYITVTPWTANGATVLRLGYRFHYQDTKTYGQLAAEWEEHLKRQQGFARDPHFVNTPGGAAVSIKGTR